MHSEQDHGYLEQNTTYTKTLMSDMIINGMCYFPACEERFD